MSSTCGRPLRHCVMVESMLLHFCEIGVIYSPQPNAAADTACHHHNHDDSFLIKKLFHCLYFLWEMTFDVL
jgi:hypothetical protein